MELFGYSKDVEMTYTKRGRSVGVVGSTINHQPSTIMTYLYDASNLDFSGEMREGGSNHAFYNWEAKWGMRYEVWGTATT